MKKLLYLLMFLPFMVKAQSKDTVKIVMLVSDTSTVRNIQTDMFPMMDTRPVMTYGYRTRRGEFLDAYKRKIGKDVIIWIAYKTN